MTKVYSFENAVKAKTKLEQVKEQLVGGNVSDAIKDQISNVIEELFQESSEGMEGITESLEGISEGYKKLTIQAQDQAEEAIRNFNKVSENNEWLTEKFHTAHNIIERRTAENALLTYFIDKQDLHGEFLSFVQHIADTENDREDIKQAANDLYRDHEDYMFAEYRWYREEKENEIEMAETE
ncbi:hypothetical protein J2Z83_000093 [Virgibacillus natechei]|uniref:Uncharacterized protein n=1 Tax=Virgibacillus natechei TaxID=1216297 RepID=A0ABS4ICB7_9BACI|nr:hypothetical protein [Virgibacillus natechei]MBP1968001.1 hypothetical protein [Virgibacillus natechei]UZD14716.1 hypothetical protein OLD84_09535 [Virgibacillus natechei]